ncbi:MAG: cobalamin-binding protein [Nitrospirales bacterium]|nr:MAG: cobalamin-binding protein [Nitrospirales bacterium]
MRMASNTQKHRIVTLIPSATEMVCALGLENQLVGRSHECDFPPSVTHLPICTEPKFEVNGTSHEIDTRVKNLLGNALSVYRVFPDVLQDLQPDVIVTQTQCGVCAANLQDVELALDSWLGKRPAIISLQTTDLSGVWNDLQAVALTLKQETQGQKVLNSLQTRMQAITQHANSLNHSPRVACIEWMDPLMAAGNWVPELVEMAGGSSLFGKAGLHAPWITWEALLQADPDIILVLPCGFSLSQIQEHFHTLTSNPEWNQLRAVQMRQVYATDGNQYFNRPGPRLVDSLEILAEIFHPQIFNFHHQGTGWVQVLPK